MYYGNGACIWVTGNTAIEADEKSSRPLYPGSYGCYSIAKTAAIVTRDGAV